MGGAHWTREVSGMESSLLEGGSGEVEDGRCVLRPGWELRSHNPLSGGGNWKIFGWNFHPDNLGK